MSSPSDLVRAGFKLWNAVGSPLPMVRVQFTDLQGSVQVTVFSTNVQGVVTSGQMLNSYSNTQSYTPTSGLNSGVPLDGPASDARIAAIAKACGTILDASPGGMIAAILAAGGTWP